MQIKHVVRPAAYLWLGGSSFLIGVGIGLNSPPAALRTLCIQLGQIFTIAIATAIIAGHHPDHIHAHIYLFIALLLVACLPLVSRIPEHKGAW